MPGRRKRRVLWLAATGVLVLAGGLFATRWLVSRVDQELRKELCERVQQFVRQMDLGHPQDMVQVTGGPTEEGEQRLRKRLAAIRTADPQCRDMSLAWPQADGAGFICVDDHPSEEGNGPLAGGTCRDVPEDSRNVFATGAAATHGPIADRWNSYIRATVPVVEPATGTVVAVLVAEYDARTWNWDVAAGSALPVGLLLGLLIGAFAIVLAHQQAGASPRPVLQRLLPSLGVALLLLVSGVGALILSMQRDRLDEVSLQAARGASEDFHQLLARQAQVLEALETVLIRDPQLIAGLQARDRERLLALFQPVFAQLHRDYAVTHLYFSDPERVCLLRVHQPDRYGDRLDRFTAIEAERTGKTAWGAELGPLGTFALRVVRPVFVGGDLIGYLELGKEIEDVLSFVGNAPELGLAVSIHKRNVSRANWEVGMKMLGREADWDCFPEDVLIYSSQVPFPMEAAAAVGYEEHAHEALLTKTTFGDRRWDVMAFPLADAAGTWVGNLVVLHDTTYLDAAQARLLAVEAGIALVFVAGLFGLLFVLLHRTDVGIRAQQAELRASEESYRNQFAMNSAVMLLIGPDDGAILDANAAAVAFYGYPQDQLLGMRIMDINTLPAAEVEQAMASIPQGMGRRFQFQHRLADGSVRDVDVSSSRILLGDRVVLHSIVADISERKRAERRQHLSAEILRALNEPLTFRDAIGRILGAIRQETGFDAVGIRLRDGDDFPYFHQEGLSADFLSSENTLVVRSDDGDICRDENGDPCLECTCGLVISGKTDSTNPLFTPGGSFWTGHSPVLLDLPPEQDPRLHPRNRCIHDGYASVALIPLRANGEIVGLLHLNDHRKNSVDLSLVEFFEGISASIGIALTRRQAEGALRASEASNRTLVENLPDVVLRLDPEGRCLFASANVTEMLGTPAAQCFGRTFREMGCPEALCCLWESSRQRVLETGEPFEAEFSLDTQRGPAIFNWRLVPESDSQGAVRSALAISRDITAHRRAEENYRMLFREMLDGFALHELICNDQGEPVDYRFLGVNPAFERLTGKLASELVGRTVLEVFPGTERHWIETYGKVALTGEPVLFENYSAELGRHFEVTAFRPAANQFACIVADITKRKQAEEEREKLREQLNQAQKMESVGRLAGGVAHDSNNMLGVILGHAEMALESVSLADPLHKNLLEIQQAAQRSADLTRQLLAFARQQTVAPKLLDLNEAVTALLSMLQRLIGEDILLTWSPDPALWSVKVDPTQMGQILTNLCVNARDAISGGGRITIETANHVIDAAYCAAHLGSAPGDYVRLTVSDSGCGMDAVVLSHLFEPFFTTKEIGKGTGLGLATVYGAVKQNGGFIDVSSKPGQGTVFRVYLPRHVSEGEAVQPPPADAPCPPVRGDETILLVEDEQSLLKLASVMLGRLGYRVLATSSGEDAMRLAREHGNEISLLMTDVVMPEMNGRELARRILAFCPHARSLFMSGHTADVIAHHGILEQSIHFIEKPFTVRQLAVKVREALDGRPSDTGDRVHSGP